MFMAAMISSMVWPLPRHSPTWRLRLWGLMQVATRSPMPARPENVSGWPPMATPSLVTSERPRVITAERVLSPAPRPSAMPEAMAITFLSTPPISQPAMSSFVYTRNSSAWKMSWTARAMFWSSMATTLAAAWPARISLARLGPVRMPTGWPGSTSSTSWLMRSFVPSSNPFDREITGTHGRRYGFAASSAERNPCDGTPTTSRSARRTASSRSAVARSWVGRRNPGR